MPRYDVDVQDGIDVHDDVDRDLADRTAVREQALRIAGRHIAVGSRDFEEATLVLTVRDATGGMPLRIRLVTQIEAG